MIYFVNTTKEDLLEKSLVNASVLSTESRVKYYNYWKNIEDKFVDEVYKLLNMRPEFYIGEFKE